jgi:MarR family 2-MHQ and catechol resistance regulon transcriptional repressor
MREAVSHEGDAAEFLSLPADIEEAQRISEHVLASTARRYKDELPWADTEAIEATLAMIRLQRMHRVAAARHIEALELGVSMTGARFTLLLTLYFARDNLLAQNDISRELSVSRTNITNLIDGLAKDGLVERVPNPADRRVSYAKLTESGKRLCLTVLPEITQFMQVHLDGFSPEETRQLKEYVYRMQRNLAHHYPARYGKGIGIED